MMVTEFSLEYAVRPIPGRSLTTRFRRNGKPCFFQTRPSSFPCSPHIMDDLPDENSSLESADDEVDVIQSVDAVEQILQYDDDDDVPPNSFLSIPGISETEVSGDFGESGLTHAVSSQELQHRQRQQERALRMQQSIHAEELSHELRDFKKVSTRQTVLEEIQDLISSIKKFKKATIAELQESPFEQHQSDRIDLAAEIRRVERRERELVQQDEISLLLRHIRRFKIDNLTQRKVVLDRIRVFEQMDREDISEADRIRLLDEIGDFQQRDLRLRIDVLLKIRKYELKRMEEIKREDEEAEERQ